MSDSNLKVLLVEDSRLLSERLLELVSDIDGISAIGTVATESDAIRTLAEQLPNVVILDLRLKEGTGFGVLDHINMLPMAARPVVIIITNYALPQYREMATAMGAGYFLDKTQEFERLPLILKSLRESVTS